MKETYVGCYFRVWMPKIKIQSVRGVCPDSKEVVKSLFCPGCGKKTVWEDVEMWPSFYDFSEAIFGDGDRFYSPQANNGEGYMIVLNNDNSPDHFVIDSEIEHEMPALGFSDDWEKLGAALEKDGIKYEAKFGIVTYWG